MSQLIDKDTHKVSSPEYSTFIALSRYARWIPEIGRRETWGETVQRYINFWLDSGYINREEGKVLYDAIFKFQVMPSMRALMTAGDALNLDNVAGFNCSYLAVDYPQAFDEALYILMCGTGVGFSCERQYINKLPVVGCSLNAPLKATYLRDISSNYPGVDYDDLSHYDSNTNTVVVADTKHGWASAARILFIELWNGNYDIKFDTSHLRPAGAKLKTFGGRASGAAPLVSLYQYAKEVFKAADGRKLTGIEVHGLMCMVGKIVTVGGVRRSALISLSNLSDDRMRHAKSGEWYLTNPEFGIANNSVAYTEKPSMETFMREWLALVESKSGERGIFNREAAIKQAAKNGRRETEKEPGVNWDYGTNPCCFTGNMELLTADGYKRFDELSGKDVKIINHNGDVTSGKVWCSGEKGVVEVKFEAAFSSHNTTCTPDHIFMLADGSECQAQYLKGKRVAVKAVIKDTFDKDDILAGFILGDGNLLSGLFSANGSVVGKHRVSLKTTDRQQASDVVNHLAGLGIKAIVVTNKPTLVKWKNGDYVSKESYNVQIQDFWSIVNFAEKVSFVQRYKRDALRKLIVERSPKVRAVKVAGRELVYDFTEPKTHWGVVNGLVVHNSEIILRSKQFCNLSEVVVRPDDNLATLRDKVKIATILGTLQATLTNFRYLSQEWADNTIEEALLGVSMTGIMDNPITSENTRELQATLSMLRNVSIDVNQEWAERLGINYSASTTCCKPSGCRIGSGVVATDSGVFTLDELQGMDVTTMKTLAGEDIIGFHDNGVAATMKIDFSYGYSETCTINHKWWVVEKRRKSGGKVAGFVPRWVETKDLEVGVDVISHQLGVFDIDRDDIQLSTYEYSHINQVTFKQPQTLTTDLSWLLGYLWGNGCMKSTKGRFHFVDEYRESMDKVRAIFLSEFGISTNIKRCSGGRNAWEIEVASVPLTNWFKENGFYKYSDQITHTLNNIPAKVRTSRKHIIAFIAGLIDSDASVRVRKNGSISIIYSCSQDEFTQHLQQICWSVGVGVGRSLNSKGINHQPQGKHVWLMRVSNVHITAESFDILAKYSYRVAGVGVRPSWSNNGSNIFGLVKGLSVAAEQHTYDIEVTGTHSYDAGVLKSHNTVSQLVDSASGIHPRYARHYIRTVRADPKDPLAMMMIEAGFPYEDSVYNDGLQVFSFPMKASPMAIFRDDRNAIEQLELWLTYQRHWCEHKPSITIYVKDDEWMEVGAWIYKHFDEVSGISFLPHTNHTYQQAPYQEITEEQYHKAVADMPVGVDWSAVSKYEHEDNTKSSQTLACTGGVCEVVDLV